MRGDFRLRLDLALFPMPRYLLRILTASDNARSSFVSVVERICLIRLHGGRWSSISVAMGPSSVQLCHSPIASFTSPSLLTSRPSRPLRRNNLHPFRLKIKTLRYILQMAIAQAQTRDEGLRRSRLQATPAGSIHLSKFSQFLCEERRVVLQSLPCFIVVRCNSLVKFLGCAESLHP